MKTRQAANTHFMLRVIYREVNIVIRFRPDQRREAIDAFILRAFLLGWVPSLDHWAFRFIELHTWESVA